MKSVDSITHELIKNMTVVTNFEKTKLLVIVDRIISKPNTNHRLELTCYSLRYKSIDKTIYMYSKPYENIDSFDYDYMGNIDFPNDFSVCITLDSKFERIINKIKECFKQYLKRLLKI